MKVRKLWPALKARRRAAGRLKPTRLIALSYVFSIALSVQLCCLLWDQILGLGPDTK